MSEATFEEIDTTGTTFETVTENQESNGTVKPKGKKKGSKSGKGGKSTKPAIDANQPELTGDEIIVHVHPSDVVFPKKFRGRQGPLEEEWTRHIAESMVQNTQEQPCVGRRLKNGKTEVVIGFTRAEAGKMINEGFPLAGGSGPVYKDPDFTLRFNLVDWTDEECFVRSLTSNSDRRNTNDIEDAENQETLRVDYKYSNRDIARIYNCDPTKVTKLKKLLDLSKDHQSLVREGLLSMDAGLELLKIDDPKVRKAVVEKAKEEGEIGEGEKINGMVIRKLVRDHVQASKAESKSSGSGSDGDGEGDEDSGAEFESPPKRQKTVKEIKTFLSDMATDLQRVDDKEPAPKFFHTLIKWIEDNITDQTMSRHCKEAFSV